MVQKFTLKSHHTQKLKLKLNLSNLAMILFSLMAVLSVQIPEEDQDGLSRDQQLTIINHADSGEIQLCTELVSEHEMAHIQVEMEHTASARLNIINIQGQTVLSQEIEKSCEIALDLQNMASGQYFIQLVSGRGAITDRLLVK